ncbi:ATP-binding protein [Streptomonospora algeriensis]|uniref:histidine kinase n=1 Tax=Streptomonospora algeriensis TaxID=995084 RepID=A0ABW3BFM4_9ACTN
MIPGGAVTSGRGEAVVGGDQPGEHSGSEPVRTVPVLSAEDLPDGLLVADRDGRIVTFNRMAQRLARVAPEDALGHDFRDVLPLHDADGRDWWKCSDPYGGLRTRTRQPERPLFLVDGREILVAARYVRDTPRGELAQLVITLRDASHRARGERRRAEFASDVSHELRTPLTSVKGFTATLLGKWDRLTDKQKMFMLETVNADADRVTRLITELLSVSRIESGRVEIRKQVVDLAELARTLVAGRVAAGEPADRFRLEVRGPLPELWLDADKIGQIMANLLENGVRHGAGTVTIVIEPYEDGAVVSVRDEGKGIAPDAVPRVFRRFWRTRRRGGTGLGLFIVKGLIEAHGGEITVGRAPSGGAEFRFTVPAGAPEFA